MAQSKRADEYVTTAMAADTLGCTRQNITHLIRTGKLKARKLGRDWMASVVSLEEYRSNRPKPGPKVGAFLMSDEFDKLLEEFDPSTKCSPVSPIHEQTLKDLQDKGIFLDAESNPQVVVIK